MSRALSWPVDRRELEARSAAFAQAIYGLCATVRSRPGGQRPADQLLDAATSVAANYRASGRARSRKEFVAKLGIVNEEADEAVYWLEFIVNTPLGTNLSTVTALQAEAVELRAVFAAAYATARRNSNADHRKRKD